MKLGALLVLIVTAILSPATSAATPPKPTPAQQLTTYLKAVQPAIAKTIPAQTSSRQLYVLLLELPPAMTTGFATAFRSDAAILGAAATKAGRIRAPLTLREPHAALVRGLRITRTAYLELAADLEEDGELGVSGAFAMDIDAADARDLQRHWRTETTIQLRRLKLTVPLWVKQVGK